jgi:hypothetical protein
MRWPRPFALTIAVLCAACAHGEAFQHGILRKGEVRVEVGPVPSLWRRIRVDGADLAFRDDARQGSALFDVRCGARDDDAPLTILTGHLIMGTTDREIERQEVIPFDGREALHTVLRAKLDGVAMQYDIYVMKKDGCVFDVVYVAPPERFADGASDFERFVEGVHTLPSTVSAQGSAASPPKDP